MLLLVLRLKENNNLKLPKGSFFYFMRYLFFIIFLFSFIGFSQQKVIKPLHNELLEVSVLSFGLDHIEIENSESNQLEIELKDENFTDYQIIVNEVNSLYKISFKKAILEGESPIFKKFITKRTSKVSAVLKIPQNKKVTIFGKDVDVYSKSYNGNFKIYVDKGEIQLNKIMQQTEVKLFDGNVSASVSNTNINIVSNNGTILINNKKHSKKYHQKKFTNKKSLAIKSINANVKLTDL